jgi:hypothetical protein
VLASTIIGWEGRSSGTKTDVVAACTRLYTHEQPTPLGVHPNILSGSDPRSTPTPTLTTRSPLIDAAPGKTEKPRRSISIPPRRSGRDSTDTTDDPHGTDAAPHSSAKGQRTCAWERGATSER